MTSIFQSMFDDCYNAIEESFGESVTVTLVSGTSLGAIDAVVDRESYAFVHPEDTGRGISDRCSINCLISDYPTVNEGDQVSIPVSMGSGTSVSWRVTGVDRRVGSRQDISLIRNIEIERGQTFRRNGGK